MFCSLINLAILTVVSDFVAAFQVGRVVETSSGPVEGHASSWQRNVSEYLGIPFAVPPVGELRWTAPKAFNGQTKIVASKFSPDCAANVLAPPGSQINYASIADIVNGEQLLS